MWSETSRGLMNAYQTIRDPRPAHAAFTGFTAELHHGERPVTVVLLPALFVGDWLWEPLWDRLTGAGWPAIRFPEAVCLADRSVARSITRLADTLSNTCRAQTSGPLVVCGDSLGALIAMEFARRDPSGTVGMVVSGAPGLDRVAERLGRDVLAGAADPREVADRFLQRLLYEPDRHGIDERRYAELVDELATPRRLETMLAGLQAIRAYDVRRELPMLAMPKLFVWGQQDLITPVDPWRDTVGRLPDARLAVFDHCGHAPMFERPAEFFDELSGLLSRRLEQPVRP